MAKEEEVSMSEYDTHGRQKIPGVWWAQLDDTRRWTSKQSQLQSSDPTHQGRSCYRHLAWHSAHSISFPHPTHEESKSSKDNNKVCEFPNYATWADTEVERAEICG